MLELLYTAFRKDFILRRSNYFNFEQNVYCNWCKRISNAYIKSNQFRKAPLARSMYVTVQNILQPEVSRSVLLHINHTTGQY